MEWSDFSNVLTFLSRSLKIIRNDTIAPDKESDIATKLNIIGFCFMKLDHNSDGLTVLTVSLKSNKYKA